ncbi:PREDICTED: uncharacterized protein LOC103080901 [Lipotes vexillifer]|uniref:Uncharacterized protein LOC103080901 n=1 Tax=Lipotes vexillifer TaxID=118797 RepID=A0A340WLU6_LIPVE|nr:PREDICTED: uncharacterized protein LOC103080901 [Lipotes vexillifer]
MTISPAPALQLTSDSKTFWRVEEELSWSEALECCWQHRTDLGDLQSMSDWSNIKTLYSLTSSTAAWIGLSFHVRLGGLRWSSGSTFSEGLCATLYSTAIFPSLGAASCTAQKPFICYYGVFRVIFWAWSLESIPQVVPKHFLSKLPLFRITDACVLQMRQAWPGTGQAGAGAEVQIGNLNLKRSDQERKWLAAVRYCCRHHTDLADLQTVTEETDKEALKSITSKTKAWIGLYFSVASGSLRWSSDTGASVPTWLQVPEFGAGLCAGLRSYWSFSPRISAVACSSLKPFICFDGALLSLAPVTGGWSSVSGGTSHRRVGCGRPGGAVSPISPALTLTGGVFLQTPPLDTGSQQPSLSSPTHPPQKSHLAQAAPGGVRRPSGLALSAMGVQGRARKNRAPRSTPASPPRPLGAAGPTEAFSLA